MNIGVAYLDSLTFDLAVSCVLSKIKKIANL